MREAALEILVSLAAIIVMILLLSALGWTMPW
jgi:hypothetical protein